MASPALSIVVSEPSDGYALLDSGHGRKLERFGAITVDRPEPQAMWSRRLAEAAWAKADGVFDGDSDDDKGRWKLNGQPPEHWTAQFGGVTATCRFSPFRHMGVFPEQEPHWSWMTDQLALAPKPARLLNLFAYTGLASLIAARHGAEVTHVDASKKAIAWAKENQDAAEMSSAPIRWIVDDARKFAAREVRRGKRYHGLIIDPPKFGRGPEGETWELFDHLPELMKHCAALLDPAFGFVVFTAYAIRASSLAMDGLLRDVLKDRGGQFDTGELAIREAAVPGHPQRLLPTSLFVRWTSHG